MSQHGFTDLSATARSGGDLTAILEAIQSSHIGASRPSYAVKGTIWCKDVDATTVEVYLYDGSADILIGTADLSAGTFEAAGAGASVTDIKDDGILTASEDALTVTDLDDYGIMQFGWSLVADDSTSGGRARVRMSDDNGSTWGSWQNLTPFEVEREEQLSGHGFINMRTGLIIGTGSASNRTSSAGVGPVVNVNTTLLSGGGNAIEFERTRTAHTAFFYVKSDGGRQTA